MPETVIGCGPKTWVLALSPHQDGAEVAQRLAEMPELGFVHQWDYVGFDGLTSWFGGSGPLPALPHVWETVCGRCKGDAVWSRDCDCCVGGTTLVLGERVNPVWVGRVVEELRALADSLVCGGVPAERV